MYNISQDLADYSIIIYKPFAFVIFISVGQMYIKPDFVWWTTTNQEIYRVADGHF